VAQISLWFSNEAIVALDLALLNETGLVELVSLYPCFELSYWPPFLPAPLHLSLYLSLSLPLSLLARVLASSGELPYLFSWCLGQFEVKILAFRPLACSRCCQAGGLPCAPHAGETLRQRGVSERRSVQSFT
jgi:hypothetical protein